jgi:molybdopterin synthase catalytic subunit
MGAVEPEGAPWRIRVQAEDFDPGAEIEGLQRLDCGAVASFVGVARDSNDGFEVAQITLEHYPGMTERALREIVAEAHARWGLGAVCVIHRVGALRPGDRIVLVGVASRHRDAAFDACRFIVDFLKTRAPFWKRESGPQGVRWVEARGSDEQALDRWAPRGPA